MSQARFGVAITADDKTARGVASALGRLKRVPKAANDTGAAVDRTRRAIDTLGSMRTRGGLSALGRTFGEIERASARAFGNRSIIAGAVGRLGALRMAGQAAAVGLGEASLAGGALSGTVGVMGVAVGGTIAVMAAAAYGAFKLASGWAKGAASIGRTAEVIGVGTRALTEFTAAAERAGVEKDAATGGLGGLSQTLNDARYGRNTDALNVLSRLGVGMKLKSDGTVDVEAMLPAIADAIARQNSSGRRTAARGLGMSEAMIPVFSQGGAALKADMADAAAHAAVLDDADVTRGKRVTRKGAMVRQLKDRAMSAAGRYAADNIEGGYDAVLTGGRAIADGSKNFDRVVTNTFKPAAEKIDRAATGLARVVENAAGQAAVGARAAGRYSASAISSFARRAMPLVKEAMRYGYSRPEATGIAANVMLESGGDHRSRESGGRGPGRGLIQWTDKARKAKFKEIMGIDVERSTRDQQWRFIRWETHSTDKRNTERRNWQRATASGQNAGSIAAGYARYVERPANKDRDSAERAAVARAMEAIPVKVEVEMRGAPAGTKVKATAGGGSSPAVSYSYAPVHGG